jgi:hypothetical protein
MPQPLKRTPSVLPPLLEAGYADAAPDLLNPLLGLLSELRTLCHGDMDLALIFLLVLIRTTEHPAFADATQAERLEAAGALPTLGINISSAAASLGLPRETARRKVMALVESGCIVRADGSLRLTSESYLWLAPLREGVNRLASKYHQLGEALLQRAGALEGPALTAVAASRAA